MSEILTKEAVNESILANNELMDIVSRKKYQLKTKTGELIENSFDDVINRICEEFVNYSNQIYGSLEQNEIVEMLKSGRFIPGGSILFGLGNSESKQSLSNCYLVKIENDSLEAIFEAQKKLARVFSFRGGSGVDITVLRPKDSPVNNAAHKSSGAVSFLPTFSEVVNTIGQNGRRAALLVSIDIRHPDALDFIWCKSRPEQVFGKDPLTGKIPDVFGANLSLKITDEFMKAVENDEDWEFYFPDFEADKDYYYKNWDGNYDTWDGPVKLYGSMKARDVLMELSNAAHISGDPGIMYITRAQQYTTSTFIDPKLTPISSNPCITGDTLVETDSGPVPIKTLAENVYYSQHKILTYNIETGKIELEKNEFCKKTRENANVIKLELENNEVLCCTPDHKIYTENRGYVEAAQLTENDVILYKK